MPRNLSAREETDEERLNRQLDQLLMSEKAHLITVGNRMALAGLVALAIAMNGAVLLVE